MKVEDAAVIDPGGRRNHGGSIIVCSFADAHTEQLISIDLERFRALTTVAGGEAY